MKAKKKSGGKLWIKCISIIIIWTFFSLEIAWARAGQPLFEQTKPQKQDYLSPALKFQAELFQVNFQAAIKEVVEKEGGKDGFDALGAVPNANLMLQDKNESEKLSMDETAKKIIAALDAKKPEKALYLFSLYQYENIDRDKDLSPTTITEAVQEAWQEIQKKVGAPDAVRQMSFSVEEVAKKLDFISFPETPYLQLLFTVDETGFSLLKRIREICGSETILWEKIENSSLKLFDTVFIDPDFYQHMHPAIKQAGSYYSLQSFISSGMNNQSYIFFHEVLERIFLKKRIIDKNFASLFNHAHIRILEEDLKFAEIMKELHLCLKRHINQLISLCEEIENSGGSREETKEAYGYIYSLAKTCAGYFAKLSPEQQFLVRQKVITQTRKVYKNPDALLSLSGLNFIIIKEEGEKGSVPTEDVQEAGGLESLNNNINTGHPNEDKRFKATLAFLMKEAKYADALELLKALVSGLSEQEKKKQGIAAFLNMAESLYEKKQYDFALKAVDEILKIDHDYTQALNLNGLIYAAKGEKKEAVPWFEAAIRSASESIVLRVNLALTYSELGYFVEALREIDKAIQIAENRKSAMAAELENIRIEIRLKRAKEYLHEENCPVALKEAEIVNNIDPQNVEALNLLAQIASGRGEYQKAIKYSLEAISLEPANAESWYNLAVVYKAAKKYLLALEAIREAIRLVPPGGNQFYNYRIEMTNIILRSINPFKKQPEFSNVSSVISSAI